jgi:hypothetical protein
MENYTPEARFWFKILDAALKMPGARIDREVFLQTVFEKYCNRETVDKILQVGTYEAGIEITLMDRMANDSIKQRTGLAAASSFIAGIPGGLAMAATIPIDVIQFYYHVIVEAQKIAYIFGLQSIDDTGENFKEFLTILIGVMAGIEDAEKTFKDVINDQFNMKLTKITVGKVLDKTIARIAAVIGIHLTKKSVGRIISKVIPFVGGIISGGMTLFAYLPMCNNLKRKLYDIVNAKQLTK